MKDTVITVVVPYKNRAAYLPDTLRSIVEQPFRPLTVILVDNGSDDHSPDICREFAAQHAADPRLNIRLAAEPKPGAAAARNRGLDLCDTEFVYFFDSDDWFDSDFLTSVFPHLNAGLDLLAVPTRMVVGGREQVRAFFTTSRPEVQVLCSHLSTQSMVFRTSFLRRIGGWNEHAFIWDDWELGVRALCRSPRMEWAAGRAFHRVLVHPDSITGTDYTSRLPFIIATLDQLLGLADGGNLQRALFLRSSIVYGVLHREASTSALTDFSAFIKRSFKHMSFPDRLMGRLLSAYVAWGGRGAWRMAMEWLEWRH